jgi:Protein of unknown function (DUF3108)
MWRLAILALVADIGGGCAGADASVLSPQAPVVVNGRELGLHPGETMSYQVQLAGVLVGEAQLAVGEIGTIGGRRALVVKSRAATAGPVALVKKIVDESTTVIDIETGQPMQVDMLFEASGKKTTATAKFEPGPSRIVNVTYKRHEEDKPHQMRIDFKAAGDTPLHDMHTAMAQIRGWRATPGTTRTVYIVGGRRLWAIEMKYIGEETVGSSVGNRRAVVFEGMSYKVKRDLSRESTKPARTFRVWLSDDADRVPLKCSAKTELGDIVMDLTEYSRP